MVGRNGSGSSLENYWVKKLWGYTFDRSGRTAFQSRATKESQDEYKNDTRWHSEQSRFRQVTGGLNQSTCKNVG